MASQRDGGISWTNPPGYKGETWSVALGCTQTSVGCHNCWAKGMVRRYEASSHAVHPTVTNTGQWNGHVELRPDWLSKPLHWREPRCVGVQLLGDLFHEAVPFPYIAAVYGVMAACPQHRFIVLTKRPERRLEWHKSVIEHAATHHSFPLGLCSVHADQMLGGPVGLPDEVAQWPKWPPPNVIEGVSVEDQKTLESRWPVLRDTPAAARCISAEPLLGPLNLERGLHRCHSAQDGDCFWQHCPQLRDGEPARTGRHCPLDDDPYEERAPRLDFVIVGGDNHISRARPCNVQLIRDIVRQCREAHVPVHLKQLGSRPITQPNGRDPNARPYPISDGAGRIVSEWPADLQDAREWPEVLRG